MAEEAVAPEGMAGEAVPADTVTGSPLMLRPVAEDQFVMIVVTSSRKGVGGTSGVSRCL